MQLRHAPLREQLADRRLEVRGERIAREEQRHVTDLEQEGDARPVRHAAVLPELAHAAGERIVERVEQILGGVVDHPQRVRPLGEQPLEPLARRRQQRAAGATGELEAHRSCRRDVDRLPVDHPVPTVGGNERTQLVALPNAAGGSFDERVDLVATVEPDVGGVEVLVAKGPDDAVDVIAVDVGDDHDVELRRLADRSSQVRAESRPRTSSRARHR